MSQRRLFFGQGRIPVRESLAIMYRRMHLRLTYPERDSEDWRHTKKRWDHTAVHPTCRTQHFAPTSDRVGNHPRTPSFASVFFTTSIAPLYMPGSAVCNRVLVRSKGCPTSTAHTPPSPPEMNAFIEDEVDETARFWSAATSSTTSFELYAVR